MRAAKLRQKISKRYHDTVMTVMEDFDADLQAEYDRAKIGGVAGNMERFRKIFRLRDDWRTAGGWSGMASVDADVRELVYRWMSRKAGDFIRNVLMVPLRDPHDGSILMTRSLMTAPGRLTLLDDYIFSAGFARDYLDLRRGGPLIIDFGIGFPPVTTHELARRARRENPDIRVVGVDKYHPVIIIRIDDNYAHFNASGDILNVSGRGPKRISRNERERYVALKDRLVQESGGKNYTAPDGATIEWYAPSLQSFQFVKGNFDFDAGGPADLIRTMNTLIYYYRDPQLLAGALLEFEDRLKEGGVLICGWKQPDYNACQFIVYRKRGGLLRPVEMVYGGISAEWMNKAADMLYDPDTYSRTPMRAFSDYQKVFKKGFLEETPLGVHFSSFFNNLVGTFIKNKRDLESTIADTIAFYSASRCVVWFDAENESMRFVYNDRAGLEFTDADAARVIARAAGGSETGDVSADRSQMILAYARERARESSVTLCAYAARTLSDPIELVHITQTLSGESVALPDILRFAPILPLLHELNRPADHDAAA